MAKNTINIKYNTKKLLLPCDCMGSCRIIKFEYFEFDDYDKDLIIEMYRKHGYENKYTLWERIKFSIYFLFKGKRLYSDDICLNRDSIEELKDFINSIDK